MPLSTSLIFSAILYVIILFTVAICNELYDRDIGRGTFVWDIAHCEITSLGFLVVAAIASVLWFITIPIGAFIIGSTFFIKFVRWSSKKIVGFVVVNLDELYNNKKNTIERQRQ